MHAPSPPLDTTELTARLGATIITGLILLAGAQVLLRAPTTDSRGQREAPLLRFILSRPTSPSVPSHAAVSAPDAAHPASPDAARNDNERGASAQGTAGTEATTEAARVPHAPSLTTSSTSPPVAHSGAASVFTPSGQAKLPPGMTGMAPGTPPGTPPGTAQARDAEKQRNVFERRDPLDYTPTRFAKDWKSDGNLAEVAGQAVGRYLDKLGGRNKDQPAAPRPPPQVAFNPTLHERAQDLGSEATGDAWRAAPIAFAPAPGEPGDAAPPIQRLLDHLQQRSLQCADPARDRWLAPLRQQLAALQRIEHRQTHGPDPGEVDLLEQQRDQTHDLARRAAWYADAKLDTCLHAP